MSKNKFVKIRLSEEEYQQALDWSEAYGDDMSGFFRRMLKSLPRKPHKVPPPPVKV